MHRGAVALLMPPALAACLVPAAAQAKRFAVACTGTMVGEERALGGFPKTGTEKADQVYVIDEDARRVAHVLEGPPAKLEDMCLSRDAACYSTFSESLIVADTGKIPVGAVIGSQRFRYDRTANHVDVILTMDRADRRTMTLTWSLSCKPTIVPDLGY